MNEQKLNFPDFSTVKMDENNPKWEQATARKVKIYKKDYDLRTPFERDAHRILHSNGYRRLKNKTQVFFAPHNDHICTRIEHVTHVASVAETIAKFLNLNLDLVKAIALGHDIGHAPFGHQGEYILRDIAKEHELNDFWHERNSLHFIDEIETLPDYEGFQQNLDLTYAVRDGIVCHCGEVDEKSLKPRNEAIDLNDIKKGGKQGAYTYEGCVVKIADKIGYIGRDIEDAMSYGILTHEQTKDLENIIQQTYPDVKVSEINTTVLMHKFIIDLCQNSSPETGFCFSDECYNMMKTIKDFNYKNIYRHPRLEPFKAYSKLVLTTIFNKLDEYFEKGIEDSLKNEQNLYPLLIKNFEEWLVKYSNYNLEAREELKLKNTCIYDILNNKSYQNAIIDFISGMSDNFAINLFNEIISF